MVLVGARQNTLLAPVGGITGGILLMLKIDYDVNPSIEGMLSGIVFLFSGNPNHCIIRCEKSIYTARAQWGF